MGHVSGNGADLPTTGAADELTVDSSCSDGSRESEDGLTISDRGLPAYRRGQTPSLSSIQRDGSASSPDSPPTKHDNHASNATYGSPVLPDSNETSPPREGASMADLPAPNTLTFVSQNVQKSRMNTVLLLEQSRHADFVLIQEIFWGNIKRVVSITNPEGDVYMNTVAHSEFDCIGAHEASRVAIYVNKRWAHLAPRLDPSVQHNDIVCITIAGPEGPFNILNVYNDPSTRQAMRYLSMRAIHLPEIHVLAGDFNSRHDLWTGPTERRHRTVRESDGEELDDIARATLNMTLLNEPGVHTWQSSNTSLQPQVNDLVWVNSRLWHQKITLEVDMDGRNNSDHAILSWDVLMSFPASTARTIHVNSVAALDYVEEVKEGWRLICDNIPNPSSLTEVIDAELRLRDLLHTAWDNHATVPKRSKRSKPWWDDACSQYAKSMREVRANLRTAAPERRTALREDMDVYQRGLKRAVRAAKNRYFDGIIAATQPHKIWDLVDWTRPRKQTAHKVLVDQNGQQARTSEELARVFSQQFNPENPRPTDPTIIQEFPQLPIRTFNPIGPNEVLQQLRKTSNSSAPGPDHCGWAWLKQIIDNRIAEWLAKFYTTCVNLAHFPSLFKESVTVIIPKPNKDDYSHAKAYRPIILLNCLGKLMEKVLAARMQFESQKFNVAHPYQYGGTIHHSTTDAGINLVHNIKQAWADGLDSTVLLLDIAQFFPSLNHDILVDTLQRQGFAPELCRFFRNYLTDRWTQYALNGQITGLTKISVGIGQGSALSPILSGLYIAAILHKWAPTYSTLCGNGTIQVFVDDGLIHVAARPSDDSDQLQYNCTLVEGMFANLTEDFLRVGLGVEPNKLEVMHFRKCKQPWSATKPLGPSVNLSRGQPEEGEILTAVHPKECMRYLGFFLDPHLKWDHHIDVYAKKACSTINSIRMLGNSVRGLSPKEKRKLYISNVLPVLSYGAQLWWNPRWKQIKWVLTTLQRTQARGARWITGAFKTTPTGAMEMTAGLLPIRQQFNKLMLKATMRTHLLPGNHPTRASLPNNWHRQHTNKSAPFPIATTRKKRGPQTPLTIIHDEACSKTTEVVDYLDDECQPGERLIDQYYNRISIYADAPKKQVDDEWEAWMSQDFQPRLQEHEADPDALIVFTDGSLKQKPTWKTGVAWAVYKAGTCLEHGKFGGGKINSFDAEMMALVVGITAALRQSTQHTTAIHVYADNKAAVLGIVDPSKKQASQHCSILACRQLRAFLEYNKTREITINWCPGHVGVPQNEAVDKWAKEGLDEPQAQRISHSVAMQETSDTIIKEWDDIKQSNKYRGNNSLWQAEHSSWFNHTEKKTWTMRGNLGNNSVELARFIRFSTGHAPLGEYRARFNIPGPINCPCGAPLETRDHILDECPLWIHSGKRRQKVTQSDRDGPFGYNDDEKYKSHYSPKDLWRFLSENPTLATFQWVHIVELATNPATRNDNMVKATLEAHTIERRLAWERFSAGRKGDTSFEDFKWDPEAQAIEIAKRRDPRRKGTGSNSLTATSGGTDGIG